MRILLVDDDHTFSEILVSNLAQRGFQNVTVAHSADEALAMVASQRLPFDCFLLDIMMPGKDGVELCRRVRQRDECRSAPIIMITSSAAQHHMGRAFEAGATDFMRKPLDPTEMEGRIRMAMLLVETTRKEKLRRNALRALITATERFNLIDLAERVSFPDIDGMMDYYQVENELLRMQSALQPLIALRVQIPDFHKLFRRIKRGRLLQQLHTISSAISETIPSNRFMLTYLGVGRFVVVLLDPGAIKLTSLQSLLRENVLLALSQDEAVNPIENFSVDVTSLADHRILSNKKALELIAGELAWASAHAHGPLPEIEKIEDLMFSRFEEVEEELHGK